MNLAGHTGMFSLVNNSHVLSVVYVVIKDAFSFEWHKLKHDKLLSYA